MGLFKLFLEFGQYGEVFLSGALSIKHTVLFIHNIGTSKAVLAGITVGAVFGVNAAHAILYKIAVITRIGIKTVVTELKVITKITIHYFAGIILRIQKIRYISRVARISYVKTSMAVFAEINIIAGAFFSAF